MTSSYTVLQKILTIKMYIKESTSVYWNNEGNLD